MDEVAHRNLVKTRERWLHPAPGATTTVGLFDENFPPHEQLPRTFEIHFRLVEEEWAPRVAMW
ncbi:hypothetical protein C3Y87_01765 [Carbonactinospora thermoautotrophica]|uniref:Putative pyrophosphatase n=1 Tax=Carbonactinospora thermoautotrophica TaxID=1469144 RepID=A0A132MWQ7_9ACTN|nr:hypothetical protein [Carbonactinospora thermoautotrophica]KWX02273.1 putative pyrophosphatase [Carbonactinospora thermoautotrophica]MCX9190159.1 hypothetical protein [Carbonactinospora thermoautotrophica]